jgi:ubiquinol-cytochrome c reductase cytochrome c1 subunit
MTKASFLLAVVLFAGSGAALATGSADVRMEAVEIKRLDVASLQRGARNFVNYCLNCHSAKYMRYRS